MSLEIRRLVLAKMLFLHGCTHAINKDSVSRMLAVHHFDNSVEIALRCIVTKKGAVQDKGQIYFEKLLGQIDGLPLKEQMLGLHRLRNAVQHQGDIPSVETVAKYKNYAEDFFRLICKDYFSISYDELFLSELITGGKLRKHVLDAEKAFGAEEYRKCIEFCDEALILATFDEADILGKAGMLTGHWGASDELKTVLEKNYPEKYREKGYYELAKELSGAILQWGQATTGMQFLDEYRMDFIRFREIVSTLDTAHDGELKENARFSLAFTTNLILKWQAEGMFEKDIAPNPGCS